MRFNAITDLSGTAYASNFDTSVEVTGLMDYTFNFSYLPVYLVQDSVVFQINSTGGIIKFVLKGNGIISNITESDKKTFKLYPNPATSFLNIEHFNSFEPNEILKIHDATGRLIMNYEIKDEVLSLDISEYSKGFYVVQVGEYTQKLIINH